MQLCLMIEGQQGVSWSQWLALARACEEHGIETLFRSDHYMDLFGAHSERGSLDAWATLCGLGAATSTLRLGTMVSPATFRHPSLLGKMVTTADHISGGRVELGLGTGWSEAEHAAYGFPFPPLGERFELLEEQLQILLGTWASAGAPEAERFSFAGEHHTLTGLRAEPGPIQRPHPPLIMGGTAGPRAARLAAAYADEYNTPFPSPGEARERREQIETACERAGRGPLAFSAMTTVLVAEDEASLRARADRVTALGGLDALAGSAAGSILSEPPPGWIVGTVESAAEQMRALGEAGVSRIMCQHLLLDDLDGVALLGERVAPLVA